jgi:hypothetical protein
MSSVTSTHIQSGSLTNVQPNSRPCSCGLRYSPFSYCNYLLRSTHNGNLTSYLREHRSNRCYLLPRNIHLRNSRNDDFT